MRSWVCGTTANDNCTKQGNANILSMSAVDERDRSINVSTLYRIAVTPSLIHHRPRSYRTTNTWAGTRWGQVEVKVNIQTSRDELNSRFHVKEEIQSFLVLTENTWTALFVFFHWVSFPGSAGICASPGTLSPGCLLGFQGSGSQQSDQGWPMTRSLANSLSGCGRGEHPSLESERLWERRHGEKEKKKNSFGHNLKKC